MNQFKVVILGVALLVALTCANAGASLIGYVDSNGLTLAMHMQGAATTLPGTTPDYDWYYGCSPTSAGMLAGYYDIYGYQGLSYRKLLRGSVAETSTYGSGTYASTTSSPVPDISRTSIPGATGPRVTTTTRAAASTAWRISWAAARTP